MAWHRLFMYRIGKFEVHAGLPVYIEERADSFELALGINCATFANSYRATLKLLLLAVDLIWWKHL